jgi:hypothetical protein
MVDYIAADNEITIEFQIICVKNYFSFGKVIGTVLEELVDFPIVNHKPNIAYISHLIDAVIEVF